MKSGGEKTMFTRKQRRQQEREEYWYIVALLLCAGLFGCGVTLLLQALF